MGKAKKTRTASVKRMIKTTDERLKANAAKSAEKLEKSKAQQVKHVAQMPSSMFMSHNTALAPPYRVLVDTNFINLSLEERIEMMRGMMDCLYAKCIPCISDCRSGWRKIHASNVCHALTGVPMQTTALSIESRAIGATSSPPVTALYGVGCARFPACRSCTSARRDTPLKDCRIWAYRPERSLSSSLACHLVTQYEPAQVSIHSSVAHCTLLLLAALASRHELRLAASQDEKYDTVSSVALDSCVDHKRIPKHKSPPYTARSQSSLKICLASDTPYYITDTAYRFDLPLPLASFAKCSLRRDQDYNTDALLHPPRPRFLRCWHRSACRHMYGQRRQVHRPQLELNAMLPLHKRSALQLLRRLLGETASSSRGEGMPELAEVERARGILERVSLGKTITQCQTLEDTIVYADATHTDFAAELLDRRVELVGRTGKQFYMVLSHPSKPTVSALWHFGMSGACQIRGEESNYYRKKPKNELNSDGAPWPPRFWKACLTFDDGSEWAFMDARRLGRIRLIRDSDPRLHPPMSLLAPDALLDLPPVPEFATALRKRTAPVKAILLDQNGVVSGLGNWLVDEFFYQSRIHPGQRGATLHDDQIEALHETIRYVLKTAVEANADHRTFPKTWLFANRWGKGRAKAPEVTLVDGSTAPITFETIGGRTTAIVKSLQKLRALPILDEAEVDGKPAKKAKKRKIDTKSEEGVPDDAQLVEATRTVTEVSSTSNARKRKTRSTTTTLTVKTDAPIESVEPPVPKGARKSKRKRSAV
ncbi:hypothetical protein E5Q_05032 [Mixia osmundae IAM 14324]|uniref:Formamidopyrimidine-DNA glycosylase catalytic domain-containing protein n=1 Tax=Mixia osmundae (strain CBS 9802 / IAM 14324 / JCM 22182 / KY 12970) TaxID=764103 RepID=G7E687_MIXOS|nr:hypothetical protein E5Q_05032 [Mixia osmundae IAM 14324]